MVIVGRLFSLIILLFVISSLFSCKLFDRNDKEVHICSYDSLEIKSELSCTTDGIIVRRCYCGRETTEVRPAYGHSYGDWQTVTQASCDAPGLEERVCAKCGSVRNHVVERLAHDYTITEEIHDGVAYNRYTCGICNESFIIDAGLDLPLTGKTEYLTNCEKSFSFIVISAEGEGYIKENLQILDYYFSDNPENQSPCEYKLNSLGNNRWLVEVKGGYKAGETYLAMRSEGVYFEKYGFCDLVFSIKHSEEVNQILINDDIIYIAALEKESPGYYPYSIELSKESRGYFLSLEKADGINAGDMICVGSATSFSDVLSGSGNNTFGIIESITGLDDGRTLILLKEIPYSQLFTNLQVYSSEVKVLEELRLPINVEERIRISMFNDEDFARLVSLFYEEGTEYIESRGFDSEITDFESFLATVKVVRSEEKDIVILEDDDTASAYAEVGFVVEIRLPVSFNKQSIGELTTNVEVKIEVSLEEIFLGLKPDEFAGDPGDIDISLDVKTRVDTNLYFDIYSGLEYTQDTEIFLFEKETELYHLNGCSAIKKTGKNYVTPTSINKMMEIIGSGEDYSECTRCKPVSVLDGEIHLTDTENMVYHTTKCPLISEITEEAMIFSEKSAVILEREGYEECKSCHKSNNRVGGFAANMVESIKDGKKGIYTEQIMDSVIDNDDLKNRLLIAAFSSSLSGIDRQIIPIYISFDFGLEPLAHYKYQTTRSTSLGFRTVEGGLKKYMSEFSEETNAEGFILSNIKLPFVTESELSLFIAGFSPAEVEAE